jgi:hypothetical protein
LTTDGLSILNFTYESDKKYAPGSFMAQCFILALLTCLSFTLEAQNKQRSNYEQYKQNFKQSHLSCAIITSEHLTVLQLYQRGLPKKLAIETLPNITRGARQRVDYVYQLAKRVGILNAYSDINTNFARCSTLVHKIKGKPAADQKEHAYYFCSGENKVRYEIILLIDQLYTLESIYEKIPKDHHHIAASYKRLIDEKGTLAGFDLTANNLKACLKQIE